MTSSAPFDQDDSTRWTYPASPPVAPVASPPGSGGSWTHRPTAGADPAWSWPGTQPDGFTASPPPPAPSAPRSRRTTPRRHRLAAGIAAGVLVVAGGFAGGFAGSRLVQDGSGSSGGNVAADTVSRHGTSGAADTVRTGGSTGIDATAVLASMKNSVVAIQAQVTSYDGPYASQGEAAGTGIVIDDSGDILTNAHVVGDAQSLTVTLPGRTEPRPASLVGADPANDVAVIRVADTTGLQAARLPASDDAQVGQHVVAIGNALALEGSLTVTEGIVSALDRSIQTEESSSLGGLIQTDAAISSGNSGGPLVDSAGTVIAMNTAVASSSDQVQASNIGFAIPIRHALAEVAGWLHQG